MQSLSKLLTTPVLTVKDVIIDPDTLTCTVLTEEKDDQGRPVGDGFDCLVCRNTGIVRHDFLDQHGYAWGFACYCRYGDGIGAPKISKRVFEALLKKEAHTLGLSDGKRVLPF